jgi:predicted GNAT family N-acyltransferase
MIDIRVVTSAADLAEVYRIRHVVFVDEQQVPVELERDEFDDDADHLLARSHGRAVGAGRLVVEPAGFADVEPSAGPVAHLGRLAVLGDARGSGLGVGLVRAIEERARERGLTVLVLSAQVSAVAFYERLGYTAYGPVFDDAGIDHRWMRRSL